MAYTTIDDPEAYFQTVIYTGNGSANNAITLPGDTDMQPDLVWIKNQDADDSHCLFDSVRGATEVLSTDSTAAEATDADTLDSFTSDGFQVDADVKVNTNTEAYVAWCWKESATAGFDIIAWTAPSSGSTTISHSLSAVPQMIISKSRSNVTDWEVYNHISGNANTLQLNTTAAANDNNAYNDTDPTSSVFSVTASGFGADRTIVSYAFAPKQGFSKFGSYTGNGNADGPFIYTGFRPAFIIMKQSDRADHWVIKDNKRPAYNPNTDRAWPNQTAAFEDSTTNAIDMLSNGFKHRSSNNNLNDSGGEFIYMAWAESPFVNSNGVPNNAE